MTYRVGVLPKSPLKYVVASVRYAPWPLVAKKMDEIQDQLRDVLPLMHHIVLEAAEGQAPAMGIAHEAWMLADVGKTYCAQISKDQVIFFTNSYIDYKSFSEKNSKVLKTLFKFMGFMDVHNLGVRYIDHVKPLIGECKTDYISEKFLAPTIGELPPLGGHIISEYGIRDHKLRVNILGIPGALPIPQEMISLPVILNGPETPFQVQPLGEEEFIADMDAVTLYQNPKRLDLEILYSVLDDLHSVANSFFRNEELFTDHAFKIWKGES